MPGIKRTNSDDPDFIALVRLLDKDLQARDGDEHSFYAQFNKIDAIKHTVVYILNHVAVGCGAIKQYDADAVEVKRMFVQPAYRGKGIAAAILNELELWAKELGYSACVLETGKKQPEAIALYHKAGYNTIPNYGQYEHIENSVCMKRDIA